MVNTQRNFLLATLVLFGCSVEAGAAIRVIIPTESDKLPAGLDADMDANGDSHIGNHREDGIPFKVLMRLGDVSGNERRMPLHVYLSDESDESIALFYKRLNDFREGLGKRYNVVIYLHLKRIKA